MDFDPSTLGPSATVVVVVAIFLKFGEKILDKLVQSIDANTHVTTEMHEYLKLRNGRLDHTLMEMTNRMQAGQAQTESVIKAMNKVTGKR